MKRGLSTGDITAAALYDCDHDDSDGYGVYTQTRGQRKKSKKRNKNENAGKTKQLAAATATPEAAASQQQTFPGTTTPASAVASNSHSATADEHSEVHESMLVNGLKKEIVQLRGTIHQLQAKVDFLLSFLGIAESTVTSSSSTSISSAAVPQSDSTADASEDSNHPNDISHQPVRRSDCSVQTTFADVARRSRPPTLNPNLQQAVVSAVYNDIAEHNRRSRNIVISGLPATGDVNDKQRVESLLNDEFAMSVDVIKCRRLGRQQPGRVQPLLAVLPSASDTKYLIDNARRLRYSSNPSVRESVYINADLTKAEAHAAYQQRCRRRGTTADRRINSNLNHPNHDDNDTTVITVNTVIGAAGIPADNTDTPTVGANGQQQQQQAQTRVSAGSSNDNAGRPR